MVNKQEIVAFGGGAWTLSESGNSYVMNPNRRAA
jgi:hypothetical protein